MATTNVFLWAAVGAPGSTHDARPLRTSNIYSDIENGLVFPQTSLNLHPHGSIPFTTVGDSAFPSHSWLFKAIQGLHKDSSEKIFQSTASAQQGWFSEHAYGMLKGLAGEFCIRKWTATSKTFP